MKIQILVRLLNSVGSLLENISPNPLPRLLLQALALKQQRHLLSHLVAIQQPKHSPNLRQNKSTQ